ncbi:MAG: hypothetical protein NT124_02360 [Candidatus Dependentiae bacterium]|nr:hypothetical protein [Candidatus Dependentiae bacterium]
MIKKTKHLIFAVTLTCLAPTAPLYAMQPLSKQKEECKYDTEVAAVVAAPRIVAEKSIICATCCFENKLELKKCAVCECPLTQDTPDMPHHHNKGVMRGISPQKKQREASQKATQPNLPWHRVNPEQQNKSEEEELLHLAIQMSLEPIGGPAQPLHVAARPAQPLHVAARTVQPLHVAARPAQPLHVAARTVRQSATYFCPACTLENRTTNPVCTLCETKNPAWNRKNNPIIRFNGRTLNLLQLADLCPADEADGPH